MVPMRRPVGRRYGTLNQWLQSDQLRTEQIMDVFETRALPARQSRMKPISGMNGVFAELFAYDEGRSLPSLGNEAAFVLDFERRMPTVASSPCTGHENALRRRYPASGRLRGLRHFLGDAKQHRGVASLFRSAEYFFVRGLVLGRFE